MATTTLNVRGIEAEAAKRIKRAARARGMTIGEYLARLVELHVTLCEQADGIAAEELTAELKRLDLEPVRT
jgi:hypothetical protein